MIQRDYNTIQKNPLIFNNYFSETPLYTQAGFIEVPYNYIGN